MRARFGKGSRAAARVLGEHGRLVTTSISPQERQHAGLMDNITFSGEKGLAAMSLCCGGA